MFCLLHVDDNSDHILVNNELDIISIINWEWSKVVAKPFAFATSIVLLPLAFDRLGDNYLSEDEKELAKVMSRLGGKMWRCPSMVDASITEFRSFWNMPIVSSWLNHT
jgi:hypothetical protein